MKNILSYIGEECMDHSRANFMFCAHVFIEGIHIQARAVDPATNRQWQAEKLLPWRDLESAAARPIVDMAFRQLCDRVKLAFAPPTDTRQ